MLADGEGRLANVEGTPGEIAVETSRGHMVRAGFGSREMTRAPAGQPVRLSARCAHAYEVLGRQKGKIDRGVLESLFGDHGDDARKESRICHHPSTLDAMLFNTTRREAHLARGPGCSGKWRTFRFDGA